MTRVIASLAGSWYIMIMNITVARRITQVAFILFLFLVPVLDIFRYDTATRELIVFGNVWGLGLKQGFAADQSALGALHIALQFFLKAILPWLVFLALFPLLGFFTGRFFCGWLCPEGTLFELSDYLTLRLLGRRSLFAKKPNDPVSPSPTPPIKGGATSCSLSPTWERAGVRGISGWSKLGYGVLALISAVVIPLLGGAALTGYLVAPRTVWGQILSWDFTFGVRAGIIGVAIYMLITSIFVRHVLCKFVCAAGLMQMLFGWISPVSLRLGMDTARITACTDCKGCDRACFMNVVPRKHKRDISCVNCGACIAACNRELGEGKGLFHLGFGKRCAAPAENCESLPAKAVNT